MKATKAWAIVNKHGQIAWNETYSDTFNGLLAAPVAKHRTHKSWLREGYKIVRVEIRPVPRRKKDTTESRLKKMLLDAERGCNCHKDSNGTLKCPVHSSKPRRKKR